MILLIGPLKHSVWRRLPLESVAALAVLDFLGLLVPGLSGSNPTVNPPGHLGQVAVRPLDNLTLHFI